MNVSNILNQKSVQNKIPPYFQHKESPCISYNYTRTIFALNGKETFSISVQSHLQVHRWCIVHKQPIIRKLSGPDVSCWTWDQRYHREHNFFFLPWFTTVDWEGWSTSHFHLRQTRWFQFPHHKFSVLSSNIPSSPAYGVFISQLIRYARACSSYKWDFPVSYSNRDTSWDAWDRDSGSFMTLIPTLTFTELRVVSMKHLQRMWHASRERLPFRTPGSVPHFGTC